MNDNIRVPKTYKWTLFRRTGNIVCSGAEVHSLHGRRGSMELFKEVNSEKVPDHDEGSSEKTALMVKA